MRDGHATGTCHETNWHGGGDGRDNTGNSKRLRRCAKRLLLASGVAGVLGVVFAAWCRQAVVSAAEGRIFRVAEEVPECEVALVLGCAQEVGGWPNRSFTYRMVVVSQEFHVQRALYLAREKGIAVHGFPARDVEGEAGRKTQLREELARVKAVLDVKVLGTKPKFLGDPVPLGG